MTIAIHTENLCKQYGNKMVVDHLNLNIQEGCLISLLGVNGAGKTTTLKMLSCLLKPSSGDAYIYDLHTVRDATAVKSCLNMSPQETAIAPLLSVKENLAFICGIYGMKHYEEKISATLKEFHLEEIQHQLASTLSGGWKRRLSIAMALISEPKILFLDEPTLGLDILARRELWDIILKLKQHITVILTTHYLEEAQKLSDEVYIMSNGKVLVQGTPQELTKQAHTNSFEDAFLYFTGGENI